MYALSMVVALGNNDCTILELADGSRILTLGRRHYRWDTSSISTSILTRIQLPHGKRKSIQKGKYWLFNVTSNAHFTRGIHLSLMITPGQWEAYLVSPSFPRRIGDQCKITSTNERIVSPTRKVLAATAFL
jgi:hypothetical protein